MPCVTEDVRHFLLEDVLGDDVGSAHLVAARHAAIRRAWHRVEEAATTVARSRLVGAPLAHRFLPGRNALLLLRSIGSGMLRLPHPRPSAKHSTHDARVLPPRLVGCARSGGYHPRDRLRS